MREAYDDRCAVSGLKLRNGGRRPEVHAGHIRPIQRNGSDFVGNGLALSGTLHWMFDPGLISVADDNETILVSRDKVLGDVVDRLSGPDGKIWKPEGKRNWLHPANLAWHRENIFAQMAAAGSAPWK